MVDPRQPSSSAGGEARSTLTGAVGLSVCLFCGSSNDADPDFLTAAAAFGVALAEADVRLVYGGGGVGLMGAAARAAHDAGGQVLGVMPRFLRRQELLYEAVETLVVEDMHERKRVMFEQSQAFAIFPGGVGTLEEVIEMLSWARLALHDKPIVFANLKSFWTPLFAMIEHTVDAKLTPDWISATWSTVDRHDRVLPAILAALEARRSKTTSTTPMSKV